MEVMDQRVSIREGKSPILLISPHGADDTNTDLLTEIMAKDLDAYAVINWGWERASYVDCFKDKANCNNVFHLKEDVVQEEFLVPILKFKKRIKRNHRIVRQFIIHGISDIGEINLILGCGKGNPSSYSCPQWFVENFAYIAENEGLNTCIAKAGSNYAGKTKKNLNQLFVRWIPDKYVQSLQLEIAYSLRKTVDDTKILATYLANIISKSLKSTRETTPEKFKPKLY